MASSITRGSLLQSTGLTTSFGQSARRQLHRDLVIRGVGIIQPSDGRSLEDHLVQGAAHVDNALRVNDGRAANKNAMLRNELHRKLGQDKPRTAELIGRRLGLQPQSEAVVQVEKELGELVVTQVHDRLHATALRGVRADDVPDTRAKVGWALSVSSVPLGEVFATALTKADMSDQRDAVRAQVEGLIQNVLGRVEIQKHGLELDVLNQVLLTPGPRADAEVALAAEKKLPVDTIQEAGKALEFSILLMVVEEAGMIVAQAKADAAKPAPPPPPLNLTQTLAALGTPPAGAQVISGHTTTLSLTSLIRTDAFAGADVHTGPLYQLVRTELDTMPAPAVAVTEAEVQGAFQHQKNRLLEFYRAEAPGSTPEKPVRADPLAAALLERRLAKPAGQPIETHAQIVAYMAKHHPELSVSLDDVGGKEWSIAHTMALYVQHQLVHRTGTLPVFGALQPDLHGETKTN